MIKQQSCYPCSARPTASLRARKREKNAKNPMEWILRSTRGAYLRDIPQFLLSKGLEGMKTYLLLLLRWFVIFGLPHLHGRSMADQTNQGKDILLQAGEKDIKQLGFTPCGTYLASISALGNTIRLWDASNGKLYKELRHRNSQRVRCFSFSPNGRILIAGYDREFSLWNWRTGEEIEVLRMPAATLSTAFHPNGKMVAISVGASVSLWNMEKMESIDDFFSSEQGAYHLTFSEDGKRLACSLGIESIRIWNLEDSSTFVNRRRRSNLLTPFVLFGAVNDSYVIGDEFGTLTFYRIGDDKPLRKIRPDEEDPISSMVYRSSKKQILAATLKGHVKLVDAVRHTVLFTLAAKGPATSLALSPNQRRLAIGYGNPFENIKTNGWISIIQLH